VSNQDKQPDPFIDEVRDLKRAASESVGHDVRRLGAQLTEIERQFKGKVVPPPPRQHPSGKVA